MTHSLNGMEHYAGKPSSCQNKIKPQEPIFLFTSISSRGCICLVYCHRITCNKLSVVSGLSMFIGPHKHFQAAKNNIWGFIYLQPPSSLIHYISVWWSRLKDFMHTTHAKASTVNHSPCWRWWKICCISGAAHLAEVPEACLRERKQALICFHMRGSLRASQRPPGGCPAAAALGPGCLG